MATGSPKIKVVVTGDATSFDRAMKGAAGKINGFGGTLRRVFNERVINAGFSVLERGVRALFDFLPKATDQADAFGDSLALIESHAKGLSGTIADLDLSKLGFSKLETASAAQDIAAVAKSVGLTDERMKTLVPNLTELAAGYAALTDTDPATSAGLFAKALNGNKKALQKLGIPFKKGSTALDRYNALMKKFGPLVKDVADGTRSAADEQATFASTISDLTTNAGAFVSEGIAPIVAFINNELVPAFKLWWGQHGQKVLDWLGDVGEAVGSFFTSKGFKDFVGLIGDITRNLIDFAAANGPGFIDFVSKVGSAIVNWVSTTGADIVAFVAGIVENVAKFLAPIAQQFVDFVGGVVAEVSRFAAEQAAAMTKFINDTNSSLNNYDPKKANDFEKFLKGIEVVQGSEEWNGLNDAMQRMVDLIGGAGLFTIQLFLDTITGIFFVLQEMTKWFDRTAMDVWNTFLDVVGDIGDAFQNLRDLVGDVFDNVQKLIDLLPKLKFPDLGGLPNPFGGISLPFIGGRSVTPFAATGGITPLAATRLGGAAAAPGGITVNVRTGVGDPVAIGRTVAKVLNAYQRRGGTIAS